MPKSCFHIRTPLAGLVLVFCVGPQALAGGPSNPPNGAATSPANQILTLTDLEQMAVEHNPTLTQAAAQVEAAQGRALQAGLRPNPTIGYEGDEIGNSGTAGQQGAFIDQVIVTGGKLRLTREKFRQEVSAMEAQALAQQYRVLNAVRMRYFELLARQRLLDVRVALLAIAEDAVKTSEELANVGQANRADLLQARIEARQERVGLENSRALYAAAWKELAALVGCPDLAPTGLAGSLDNQFFPIDLDAALSHLLEASPEVMAARSDVLRSQFALRREEIEPRPNVRVRVGTQYNFETGRQQALAQVGVTVPLFDRNQGNIRAAQAQFALAQAGVTRVELSLRQRFARAGAQYATARATAETYQKEILPEAREAFELYLKSFKDRRAAYPQVLIAQRNYFQASVDYIDAVQRQRRAEVAISGLLLVDGLQEPAGAGADGRTPRRESERLDEELRGPIGREGRSPEERLGIRPGGE